MIGTTLRGYGEDVADISPRSLGRMGMRRDPLPLRQVDVTTSPYATDLTYEITEE
jgi:hypothetical protein